MADEKQVKAVGKAARAAVAAAKANAEMAKIQGAPAPVNPVIKGAAPVSTAVPAAPAPAPTSTVTG